jgi:hypothetical protein
VSARCARCGLPADEHHEFMAPRRPSGCVCDAESWDGNIDRAPCAEFSAQIADKERCNDCEHDEACHAAKLADGTTYREGP